MRNKVIDKIKTCMSGIEDIKYQIKNVTMGDPEERSEGIEKHIQILKDKKEVIWRHQRKLEQQLSIIDGEDPEEDLLSELFNLKWINCIWRLDNNSNEYNSSYCLAFEVQLIKLWRSEEHG